MTDQHSAEHEERDRTRQWGATGRLGGPLDVPSRIVVTTRYGILLSIVGVAISSLVLLVYCLVVMVSSIVHAFTETSFDMDGARMFAVELIELTDFFLLGMVLYVVAIGMYQLFVDPDLPVAGWMRVRSLDDLKTQILNVIVVLLVVTFLASAITWSGGRDVIYFGAAVSAVILAVSVYTFVHRGNH